MVRALLPLRDQNSNEVSTLVEHAEATTGLEPVITGRKPDALAAKLSPQIELKG